MTDDFDAFAALFLTMIWAVLQIVWIPTAAEIGGVFAAAVFSVAWTLVVGAVYHDITAGTPLVPPRPPGRRGVVHVGPVVGHLVAHGVLGVVALVDGFVGVGAVAVRRAVRWLVVPKVADGGDEA